MALSIETTDSLNWSFATNGNQTATKAFTVTSANVLVVVTAASEVITGVTWNGVAMTSGATHGTNAGRVAVWYMINPATGTHNVVATNANNSSGSVSMGIIGFLNANVLSSPVGANVGTLNGNVTGNQSESITTTAANSYLVGGLILAGVGSNSTAVTVGAGNTTLIDGTTPGSDISYRSAGVAGSKTFAWVNAATGGTYVTTVVEILQDTRTTFVKTASATVSNAASRLASVVRLATFKRTGSATVSNSASRLASVAQYRFHIFVKTASVSVSNAVSRLATVFGYVGWRLGGKSTDSTNAFGGKSADSTNAFGGKSTDSTNTYIHKS